METRSKWLKSLLFIVLVGVISGCSTLSQLAKMQKPEARVQNVRVTGLSFNTIDLMFDIDVRNPNTVGINLNSFDYNLNINGNSFLSGDNQDGLEIAANGQKTVNLPLTLKFSDIYNTFSGVQKQDSTGYELSAGFAFNVPVLGAVRIPVSKAGSIPNVKLPKISVGGLKLNNLSLSGADLELKLNVENPNVFGLNLSKLNYNFNVNDKNWGSGVADQMMSVNEKGTGELKIPFKLNFMEMGMTLYNMLKGDDQLNYNLKGNLDFGTSLPLLKGTTLNFDKDGNIQVQR
ncbi:MAG: LEA type 2 family protein [Calditrichaeota bacterium]|nr:LEA type 2 family protein [Calditrichota bacterium]MCB0287923.1 LEA type 2 family protein [Calditrichota bacterium]MCB9070643.1 LEA type 2 family protein [Calditrichia bacterium]